MADLTANFASNPSRIVGRSEEYAADVVLEDGVTKLLVKSTVVPQILGNRITKYALLNGTGTNEMDVNGSGTAKEFIIKPEINGDLIIESLVFECITGGIKIGNFLSLNSALSVGVVVEIKSNDTLFSFLPIKNTIEFDSLFAYGSGRSYSLVFASGDDSMVARFGPSLPFLIKEQGTFAIDDYVKVTISDNIGSLGSFRFLGEGTVDL